MSNGEINYPMSKETFTSKSRSTIKNLTFLFMLVLFLGNWQVVSAQCVLACNDDVNISLPGPGFGCQLEIKPEMLATASSGTGSCVADLQVLIMTATGVPLPNSPFIDHTHIGQTLTYRLTHNSTGNSCWGQILVEDKLRPLITNCGPQNIHCFQDPRPIIEGGDVPIPNFEDCSEFTIDYIDQFIDEDCSQNVSARILRTWTARDIYNNVATCTQEIFIDRVSLSNAIPHCPTNINYECNAIDAPSTEPDSTGYPFFVINSDTFDIIPGDDFFCELAVSFTDEEFDICGGGRKILRTWTIYDWCMPTILGTNPYSCIQVIKVEDTIGPEVSLPDTISATSNNITCDGIVNLPPATITDNCSNEFNVEIVTPVGNFEGNGGQFALMPVGIHTLYYYVTDLCDNTSIDSTTLVITDDAPPIAICNEHTTVSLSLDGTAVVFAETFDDGSYDNCAMDRFEVRRMASSCNLETTFDDFVTFTCCELDESIMVIFRAYDTEGNFNDCMVDVDVQDKLDPVINCPENKTIQCTDDFSDLSIFGVATAFDNCGTTISENSFVDLNSCGTGTIFRTFTAIDPTGRSVTCDQTIIVNNDFPFDGDQDIIWPSDYETFECGAEVDPEDLPSNPINYREPIFNSGACDLVAASYEDDYLPIAPPACYKIIRTWTVIDWCQYEPNGTSNAGIWQHEQVIKVSDVTSPDLECPPTGMIFENLSDDCSQMFVEIPLVTATDCNEDLFFSYRVDLFADGIGFQNHLGNDASGVYPNGTHQIAFTVEDGCGNATTCPFEFTIRDGKAPTPVCINGISVDLMEMGGADGMVEMTADMFNGGSYDNCTDDEDLDLEISPSVFTCDNLGTNLVYLTVSDDEGNSAFCQTIVVIQDNNGICPGPQEGNIQGLIQNEDGEMVENVTVEINGYEMAPVLTGLDGSFRFDEIPMYQDYSLTPEKDMNHTNGVSTFDLVLLQKHILGITHLDSPYKVIAGDVNQSGSISTFDMVQIRKLILQINTEFPNSPSWRFVAADYEFPNPANPFAEAFPEVININNFDDSNMVANFVAIKVGDVNGSATTNNLIEADERNNSDDLVLSIQDKVVLKNEVVEVNFETNQIKNVFGYQFTLEFDEKVLEFITFASGEVEGMTTNNFAFHRADEGVITTSWDNTKNTLNNNNSTTTTLFTLTFRAKTTAQLSEIFTINSRYTKAEAYHTNSNSVSEEISGVQLQFHNENGAEAAGEGIQLNQNSPNPFSTTTTIEFFFPKAGTGTLTVYDLSGRTLKVINGTFSEGHNAIVLNRSDLATSGVAFYRLETPFGTGTKKMILD